MYKKIFEKRIKDDFRLYYFKKNINNVLVLVVLILLSNKKYQQEEIDKLKESYKILELEVDNLIINI